MAGAGAAGAGAGASGIGAGAGSGSMPPPRSVLGASSSEVETTGFGVVGIPSASSDAWCAAAAAWTSDASATKIVFALPTSGLSASRTAPQRPQNLKPGGFWKPQLGHGPPPGAVEEDGGCPGAGAAEAGGADGAEGGGPAGAGGRGAMAGGPGGMGSGCAATAAGIPGLGIGAGVSAGLAVPPEGGCCSGGGGTEPG